MAPRTSRRQKTKASSNASKRVGDDDGCVIKYPIKDSSDDDEYVSKYLIKDCSNASETTTSPTSNSDSDREQGSKCSETIGQDTPPSSIARTSLKSLRNRAQDFVPTGIEMDLSVPDVVDPAMMAPPCPPCMPTPGKDYLMGVIQSTLGTQVWDLNMMDFTSYEGQWCTAVEITIPEFSASNCHLVASQDVEAIAAAQNENKSQVKQSLTQALQGLKPNVVIDRADHRAEICMDYCAANRNKLCQDFTYWCGCPRVESGGKCRWAHAMIETFMINFVLAPLAQWGCGTEAQAESSLQTPPACETKPTERWQPKRPPMPPKGVSLVNIPRDTQCQSPKSAESTPVSSFEPIKSLSPDMRPKNPRLVSTRRWSDVLDDSDDGE